MGNKWDRKCDSSKNRRKTLSRKGQVFLRVQVFVKRSKTTLETFVRGKSNIPKPIELKGLKTPSNGFFHQSFFDCDPTAVLTFL
ncbi:hypothetical protein BBH88_18640 (plasmid) [Planococcus antarcticus DSM 14505]|uniref:Uncharacterized protein n=1 Tax=Planococcus antarcticus DSM 14505 TaxID=1185653 RepID=A0ABN4RJX7_9BACL|nr:hypothetical protein BBH88_18525 [Planococcus antarcticus DSM 14505]ANU12321.1 hypothetical protein BBH88_18640 [Planococcus antarcticus DSM 14505]